MSVPPVQPSAPGKSGRAFDGGMALVTLAICALVTTRALQLSTLGPLLYSPEFAQLGNLAADLAEGRFSWPGSFGAFYDFYAYGDHAPGTLFIALTAVPFSALFGPTTDALHACAITLEALFVGLTALAGVRLGGRRVGGLLGALLVVPPLFVVGFQLMPYGNHTQFLLFPALFLLAIERGERGAWSARRQLGTIIAVAASVFLYRLNLAPALALAGTMLLSKAGPDRRFGALGVVGGIGLGLLGGWLLNPGQGAPPGVVLPGLQLDLDGLAESSRALLRAWPASLRWATNPGGVAFIGSAAAVALAAVSAPATSQRASIGRFLLLWFVFGVSAPLLSGQPRPEYLLSAYYASLVSLGIAAGSPRLVVRRLGIGFALVLLAGGLIDGVRAIAPRTAPHYEGVQLSRRLRLDTLDVDEIPYWNRILAGQRDSKDMGLVTRIGACRHQFARALTFVPQDFRADRCGDRCEFEGLERLLRDAEAADPTLDRTAVGRALWIVCNRDLAAVERVAGPLGGDLAAPYLEGARDEARR